MSRDIVSVNDGSAFAGARILVTGGAGFIGSALVRHLISNTQATVLNFDLLTYAGNLASVAAVSDSSRYQFICGDVRNREVVANAIDEFKPTAIMHLAAESHVDRSIDGPAEFITTNVLGTGTLLEEANRYWKSLSGVESRDFRFLHISTDEVFGSLGAGGFFSETSAYAPNSPYAASKAGADHLVRAWNHTFGFPALITNCSNNYGPCQFPEKLIPLNVIKAAESKPMPVYGQGTNVRDWLYVDDHVSALLQVLRAGKVGETYLVGGHSERSNLEVVSMIADCVDQLMPRSGKGSRREELITFVADRPGHDFRYAIDPSRLESELGWRSIETFESGLMKTVKWYLENQAWCESALRGNYDGARLGKGSVA